MGRPQDNFCWEHVEKVSDTKWRCKYCKVEFSGAASRIRSHLSGVGDLSLCPAVPVHIQLEALSNGPDKKRARHSSSVGEGNDLNVTISAMINNSSQDNGTTNVAPSTMGTDVTASTTSNEVTLGAANDNSVHDASASERLSNGDNAGAASTMINNSWDDSSLMALMNYTSNVTASTMGNNCLELVAPHQASTSNDVANDTVVEHVTDPSLDASERLSNGDNVVTDTRETDQDPIPSSFGGDPNLLSVQDAELYVSEALVKSLLLKSNNLLVDFIKDPNFRIFLERVRQYGVPASLLGDDTPIIEKSLMSYKEEVRRYISTVKESWETTGCTMMVYNLTRRKGKLSDLDKDNNVLGFYSPKGFIFFEDLSMDGWETSRSLHFTTDVKHFIGHDDDRIQSYCELVDPRSISRWGNILEDIDFVVPYPCLRHQIQRICSEICKESEWLKGLFNKAEKLHHQIVNSHLGDRYYRTLEKKELKEFEDGKQTSPPSSFVSIMLLEDELKTWLPNPIYYGGSSKEAEIEAALNDSEFWIQGRLVQRALYLILEFADLMDTFVPSAGYLKLAFDNLKRELNSCNRPHTPMLDQFWKDLYDGLRILDNRFYYSRGATRLNPAYFRGNEDLDLSVSSEVDRSFYNTMGRCMGEVEEEEIKRYSLRCSNPFANISQQERQNTHPIKLWENHGNDFPQLQKCAIHLFSQPVSCLCNQVKKHLSELEGADNLILRLNARMMEQFRILGDDIYKPIDCKPRVHW